MTSRFHTVTRIFIGFSFGSFAMIACKDDKYGSMLDAGATPLPSATVTPADADAGKKEPTIRDAGVSSWDGSMPERPLPKGKTTVTASMPPEIQLRAIGYMNAMQQPRFDDAWIDDTYVAALVEKLKPINLSFDKGSAADKAKFNRIDVIGKGRKIDLLLASGCSEDMPKRAAVQRGGSSFDDLKSHGVLVVSCHDRDTQCLQSTRDPNDVLCTTAPRHK